MIELRFHGELYDGFAIDEAAKIFAPFGDFELVREPEGFLVRVSGGSGEDASDEATLAAEFANYALGLSVERASEERPA